MHSDILTLHDRSGRYCISQADDWLLRDINPRPGNSGGIGRGIPSMYCDDLWWWHYWPDSGDYSLLSSIGRNSGDIYLPTWPVVTIPHWPDDIDIDDYPMTDDDDSNGQWRIVYCIIIIDYC